ncbi:MAG: hypothetical protein JWO43_34 [Candidatus Adlerbacteria bacterium]|nr:hypothetical protein [Candidatus Adlerbacteria bacterium]
MPQHTVQTAALPVDVKIEGEAKILSQVPKKALAKATNDLLVQAGLRGTFTLKVTTLSRVLPTAHGLQVKSPCRNSVELRYIQEGGNQCFKLALIAPRYAEIYAFHRKLQAAEKALNNPIKESPKIPEGENIVNLFQGSAVSDVADAPAPALPAPEVQSMAEPQAQPPVSRPSTVLFVDNDTRRSMFMEELCRRSEDSLISKSICREVLIECFDISTQGGGWARIVDSFVRRKYLKVADSLHYRIPYRWFKKFNLPVAKVAADSLAEHPALLSQVPVLTSKFEVMARLVDEHDTKRARLSEIIHQQAALDAEKAKLEQELAEPKYQAAIAAAKLLDNLSA